jgi:hypothetical protein
MFIGMPFGHYSDKEFEPVGLLRVETERSVWFVSGDRYQRIPREERPRAPERCIDGRLTDAQWHGLRRCWWREHTDGEVQLRLLPTVGPESGVGVVTGVVVEVAGAWVPLDDGTRRQSV